MPLVSKVAQERGRIPLVLGEPGWRRLPVEGLRVALGIVPVIPRGARSRPTKVDHSLLGTKGEVGPRLGDVVLAVQVVHAVEARVGRLRDARGPRARRRVPIGVHATMPTVDGVAEQPDRILLVPGEALVARYHRFRNRVRERDTTRKRRHRRGGRRRAAAQECGVELADGAVALVTSGDLGLIELEADSVLDVAAGGPLQVRHWLAQREEVAGVGRRVVPRGHHAVVVAVHDLADQTRVRA
mmetsp:Transcript_92733/g.265897  ORF Transcript_92733/g.265897 Transcript_92733/m.265897 type:complete len:242 (-) Transcript_92733:288-1013(-)